MPDGANGEPGSGLSQMKPSRLARTQHGPSRRIQSSLAEPRKRLRLPWPNRLLAKSAAVTPWPHLRAGFSTDAREFQERNQEAREQVSPNSSCIQATELDRHQVQFPTLQKNLGIAPASPFQ